MLHICVRVVLTALCLCLLAITAFCQPLYRMRLLGGAPGISTVVPTAVNLRGEVVGWMWNGDQTAFRWNPVERLVELPVPHVQPTLAYGINDAGDIVGVVGGGSPSSVSRFGFLLTPQYGITRFDGAPWYQTPLAINNRGQFAGGGENGGFLWTPDVPNGVTGTFEYTNEHVPVNTVAYGLNNRGQVTGRSQGPDSFLWDPSDAANPFVWLPPLNGHRAAKSLGINDAGVTVGHSYADTDYRPRAVMWTPSGQVRDLGQVGDAPWATANDINNAGVVVGKYIKTGVIGRARPDGAMVWTEQTGMLDLGTLVVNVPVGMKLREATAVNERGQIIGFGTYGDSYGEPSVKHAFILDPIPEPSTLAALAVGASGLLLRRRR